MSSQTQNTYASHLTHSVSSLCVFSTLLAHASNVLAHVSHSVRAAHSSLYWAPVSSFCWSVGHFRADATLCVADPSWNAITMVAWAVHLWRNTRAWWMALVACREGGLVCAVVFSPGCSWASAHARLPGSVSSQELFDGSLFYFEWNVSCRGRRYWLCQSSTSRSEKPGGNKHCLHHVGRVCSACTDGWRRHCWTCGSRASFAAREEGRKDGQAWWRHSYSQAREFGMTKCRVRRIAEMTRPRARTIAESSRPSALFKACAWWSLVVAGGMRSLDGNHVLVRCILTVLVTDWKAAAFEAQNVQRLMFFLSARAQNLIVVLLCSKTVWDCVSSSLNCRHDPFASSSPGHRTVRHFNCTLQLFLVNAHTNTRERTLDTAHLLPNATKVAPAALGGCINCHQSDLNSIRVRVAGETISSTNSEHREKQPGRLGRGRDHFFSLSQLCLFLEHEAKGLPRTISGEILFKTSVIDFAAAARARHIRIRMVVSWLRILTCSTVAKCIQSWFVVCLRFRLCQGAWSCQVDHRQLQCPSVPSVTSAILKI